MDEYVENYKYNNCFWKKSQLLYDHSDSKFKEYISIGKIFKSVSKELEKLPPALDSLEKIYEKPNEPNYTREEGIQVILNTIKRFSIEIDKLSKNLKELARQIFEKKDGYESQKAAAQMCIDKYKEYDGELNKLKQNSVTYFDSMNKVVEAYINQNLGKKGGNSKSKPDFNNKLKTLLKKKQLYKDQVEKVEKLRTDYMDQQGNIFAIKEEFERDCTDELKVYFKSYINYLDEFCKNIKMSEKEINIIEKIDGEQDTISYAESNKSLMTGPKRNTYQEYSIDINYYVNNFDIVKTKLKGKTEKEIREIKNQLSKEITNFLQDIIKEEPNEIIKKIEDIAKDLKENKLDETGYKYLIEKFEEGYISFMNWKEKNVGFQDYKKVGKEWDERYIYMHVFTKYLNKKRIDNKELNEENFDYLCGSFEKILELNGNEDIDYNLCDLLVILSSTFYRNEPKNPSGKKYINEVIKNSPVIQKQWFWVGLTRFKLNEELQHQNKIEDTLKEDDITEDKLNNNVVAQLMSVTYNIVQFINDSTTFNKIIKDIFKYCKINEQNKLIVVEMIDSQIKDQNFEHLSLDKDMLLTINKEA